MAFTTFEWQANGPDVLRHLDLVRQGDDCDVKVLPAVCVVRVDADLGRVQSAKRYVQRYVKNS